MSVQTTYPIYRRKGLEGQLYDQSSADIVSKVIETVAGVSFGRVVSRGTDPSRQADLGGTAFLGIALRDLAKEGAANTGAIQWNFSEVAAVLREGYVWVAVPSGCTAGDAAKYNTSTGIIDSGAAGAGEAGIGAASFETTASAGELAVLRIGLN